ncbi:hypothetical protein MYP_1046 [Sporocytophaga myxococcoides]|uniref:Uncharacterized protein n=1 Tax=Sporocytophaga myxococcoides TaxID=153721 RepID=A0A098LCM8_9BACT|nr:glycosyltransferase [Sporocytophaga myxococcoides]GAL83818.1 hypothetical protein MYP_1046 [Sporocytophaga myxococcoides]
MQSENFIEGTKGKTSIVVPVYADWNSLSKCIDSLILFAGDENVYLINDNGPEADSLEEKIKNKIKDKLNFKYYRNEQNLGFIKTCNRAVFELDNTANDILLLNSDTEVTEGFLEELRSVLYLNEKHAACCPRSNNASLLSIPLFFKGDRSAIADESFELFSKLKTMLPKFSIIPTGVGFCMLIKRSIINNFGLFDEIYGKGYNEENDFCMRINEYGFTTVMANHAFVYHHESKSFGKSQRESLDKTNYKILKNRYPYYSSIVDQYFKHEIHVADNFSALFSSKLHNKSKILFCVPHLNKSVNGTVNYALNLLENFYNLFSHKFEIHVLTLPQLSEIYGLGKKYPDVVFPDTVQDKYDLAIMPSQIFNFHLLNLINKVALRMVITFQDIIATRCNYIVHKDFFSKNVFELSLKHSDGIIFISETTKSDTEAFFGTPYNFVLPTNKIIYHGTKNKSDQSAEVKNNAGESYALIVGNSFKHKAVNETIKVLSELEGFKAVAIGGANKQHGNFITEYKSGTLSEEKFKSLYKNCNYIIYPSFYEGFGLPLIEALQERKNIFINDTSVNRELSNGLLKEYKQYLHFFSDFKHLKELLSARPDPKWDSGDFKFRTWNDVAQETGEFLEQILNTPIQIEKLNKRWKELTSLAIMLESPVTNSSAKKKRLKKIKSKIKRFFSKLV